jgi:hypothetical protein
MSDEVAALKAELERANAELGRVNFELERANANLGRYRRLFLCDRCSTLGHDTEYCIKECGVDADDDGDVFMHSRIDPRFHDALPLEMWTEALRRLSIPDIVKLPRVCRLFSDVVWGRNAGALLWRELPPGMINTEDHQSYQSLTILERACKRWASVGVVKTLLTGGAEVTRVAVSYNCGDDVLKALVSAGGGGQLASRIFGKMKQKQLKNLISVGADVNFVNRDGYTPLMRAVIHDAIGNIRILLAAGANKDVRSTAPAHMGMTASEIAAATLSPHDNERIQRALRKKRVVK